MPFKKYLGKHQRRREKMEREEEADADRLRRPLSLASQRTPSLEPATAQEKSKPGAHGPCTWGLGAGLAPHC